MSPGRSSTLISLVSSSWSSPGRRNCLVRWLCWLAKWTQAWLMSSSRRLEMSMDSTVPLSVQSWQVALVAG
eukprot:5628035-Heterocapsa_arctica.AAC.1